MKLTSSTLAVLKNFASINTNLTIKPGNQLTTISAGQNIIARATVTETFPTEFGIYDLNEFLGALSLMQEPSLKFDTQKCVMTEGRNRLQYYAASASILKAVPDLKAFPQVDVEFDLEAAMLSQIQRTAAVLRATDFSVVGDGTTVSLQVGDKANPTANAFNSDIGETDKTFRVNFKVDNLKLLAGDYKVSIGGKKISRFQALNREVLYYVAIERDSTFDF